MRNIKLKCMLICIVSDWMCACHPENGNKQTTPAVIGNTPALEVSPEAKPTGPTQGDNPTNGILQPTQKAEQITETPTPTKMPVRIDSIPLRINELMASNEAWPIDGKIADWVELYNFGTEPVDLGKLWISDEMEYLHKCKLPERILGAGEYLVLTAGKKDCDISFALSKEGETLWIVNEEGNLVDCLSYGKIKKNVAFCRDFGYVGTATPGKENHISTADSSLTEEQLRDYTLDILSVAVNETDFKALHDNYNKTVTYPIHLTYYAQTTEGPVREFSYTAGMEIYGNSSRIYERCSYQIKFKKEFGQNRLYYKLFEDRDCEEFSSFTLRGGSQDAFATMLRDEFIASLWRNYYGDASSLMTESFTPVNLYINGEYYGIFYIREHLDEDTLAADYGCEPEETGVVNRYHSLTQGSKNGVSELIRAWEKAPYADYTKQEEYEELERVLNLDSLIDFYLLNIWAENRDLIVRNVKIRDGKWFYALHDLDLCFRPGKENATMQFVGNENAGAAAMNTIIFRLLKREDFRQRYEKRMEELLNTVLAPEYVTGRLDLLLARLDHDMKKSCNVWSKKLEKKENAYYISYSRWQEKTAALRKQMEERKDAMLREWEALWGKESEEKNDSE